MTDKESEEIGYICQIGEAGMPHPREIENVGKSREKAREREREQKRAKKKGSRKNERSTKKARK